MTLSKEDPWCRICGEVGAVTIEHTPPRAAFNRNRGRAFGLDDWLRRYSRDDLGGGIPFQGGNKAPTLCERCNNFCGTNYAREYVEWARALLALLAREMGDLSDPLPDGGFLQFSAKDRYPGRFVRQVLAMFLSGAPTRDLRDRHPQLVRAVLDPESPARIEPLQLFMVLFVGPYARTAAAPSGILDVETKGMAVVLEIAHPPFAFLLSLEGGDPSGYGADISSLAEVPSSKKVSFDAEFNVGHGWTPLPGDYRSRQRIEAEAARHRGQDT